MSATTPLPLPPEILDHLPVMVWCVDSAGHCSWINQEALRFAGTTWREAEGTGWLDAFHSDDRERALATVRNGPSNSECRMRSADGSIRWVSLRAKKMHEPDGTAPTYMVTGADIHEQRTNSFDRRRTQEFVQFLSHATRELIWTWDIRTEQIAISPALEEVFGPVPHPLAEAYAWWNSRVNPDDRSRVITNLEGAFLLDSTALDLEYRIADRHGAERVLDDRLNIIRDENGRVVQIIGAARDVTARKRDEQSSARLARILEATPDVVGISNLAGDVLYLNRAARELAGMREDASVLSQNIKDMHPEWAYEIVRHEGIPCAIRDGAWEGETALIAGDGREVPVSQLILSHTRKDGTVDSLSTIMRDISERKREEVARIEWANRYDAAIRASGQLLIDWNSFTNEITYGGNTEQILGYTIEDLSGGLDRLRELVHPEDLAAFDKEVERVASTRDPFSLSFRLKHRSGNYIAAQTKGYFFLDREGRLSRMIGFLADTTAERQAQEELALAQESLETRVEERTAELARAYIVIQDRALQQEAVAHLGQRALAGAQLHSLFDETTCLVCTIMKVDLCGVLELTPDGRELVARALAGWPERVTSTRASVPMGRKSQSGFTLESSEPVVVEDMDTEIRFEVSDWVRDVGAKSGVTVTIATGEQPIGILSAFTLAKRQFTKDDVNFLQSVANVLTAAIVRQRAEESLRVAHEQAETANRAKSEFLSRMSHELRTPLNAILGFTQLLELDKPTESQSESIAHISRGGNHLLSLINEVLDIARIETGRLTLSPETIPLMDFLRGALSLIRPLAQRFEIELILEASSGVEDAYVHADGQRFKQVMLNLLSNAVKYNRPKGKVVVNTSPGEAQPDSWRVSVSDTGHGIPAGKLDRLFVPFERLGAEATDIEGTGIGLALSKGIVAALDGTLGVQSVEGEGSTFWLELPRAEAGAGPEIHLPATVLPPAAVSATRTYNLLYIEDQDLNLRLVERILLHRPEYRLLTAMQGGLGIDLAREHRPDLILLDLNLPDIPGDEVLSRLRQEAATQDIPVIMISADATSDRIAQLLSDGAIGYLTKPYKVTEFLEVIDEALERN
ncbi:MAG: PAS domain-containing protein [Chthoniobacteraceae bacterium]